jgi:hypothetical protein
MHRITVQVQASRGAPMHQTRSSLPRYFRVLTSGGVAVHDGGEHVLQAVTELVEQRLHLTLQVNRRKKVTDIARKMLP